MESLKGLVSEHGFFKGLAPEFIDLVTGCAKNVHFPQGAFMFREDEAADEFYLLRFGRVAIEIAAPERGAIVVQTLVPGEVVGWSWLFPPYRWHFDARAVEEVRAISIDGACLRAKCEQDNSLGYELMKRSAHIILSRLESASVQLLDVYGHADAR
jgi:CRP-like cAMP-binding protein